MKNSKFKKHLENVEGFLTEYESLCKKWKVGIAGPDSMIVPLDKHFFEHYPISELWDWVRDGIEDIDNEGIWFIELKRSRCLLNEIKQRLSENSIEKLNDITRNMANDFNEDVTPRHDIIVEDGELEIVCTDNYLEKKEEYISQIFNLIRHPLDDGDIKVYDFVDTYASCLYNMSDITCKREIYSKCNFIEQLERCANKDDYKNEIEKLKVRTNIAK